MRSAIKWLLPACLLLFGMPWAAAAQDDTTQDIPEDVYYLMPSFGKGMVYFKGRGPAQGTLNICAVDNSLRFLDDAGREVVADPDNSITKVLIDNVFFMQDNGLFLRMYPVSADMGVALWRDVTILKDQKRGAYGTESRTNSITEYGTLYTEGRAIRLEEAKKYPYNVSESLFLYKGDNVVPLTKKNLRKFFPEKKDEIDAMFKTASSLPDHVDELLELLDRWTTHRED